MARIDEIFGAVKNLLRSSCNQMDLVALVEALERKGYDSADISFSLAHLVASGRLSWNGDYRVSVEDDAPYALAV